MYHYTKGVEFRGLPGPPGPPGPEASPRPEAPPSGLHGLVSFAEYANREPPTAEQQQYINSEFKRILTQNIHGIN